MFDLRKLLKWAAAAVAMVWIGGCATPSNPAAVAPIFKIDPAWPQPLPNRWILGQVSGVEIGRAHV